MKLIQEGPRDAKVMLVGEAPGVQEEATGRPFYGGSGMVLNKMLDTAGIRRTNCFVTNICHVRPKKNEFSWFMKKENQYHLLAGLLQLKADIEAIKPNLVIALGAQPLRVLTGKRGIDDWRGSILESNLVPGTKVIGTYHPAYILRIWDYKAVAEFDLRRCAEEAKTSEIVLPFYKFLLHDTWCTGSDDRRGWTHTPADPTERTQYAELLRASPWLSVDIECSPGVDGRWKVTHCAFSAKPGEALVIASHSSADLELIRYICSGPSRKIFQNGTFDTTVLLEHGIPVPQFDYDTMLGHHALFPECAGSADETTIGKAKHAAIQKGLAFQTSIYTRQPYYKAIGKVWKDAKDSLLFRRYNAMDAAITREIKDVQTNELMEYGTYMVAEHEFALIEPLRAATIRGIRIDLARREELNIEITGKIQRLQDFVDATVGPINVKSPKQMVELLYEKLGLPKRYNKTSGNLTADGDALVYLLEKTKNPVLGTILKIRENRDLVERYLNAAISSDGRMRCSFDITGTRSGRLSSRASIDGSGTNLQNIPTVMREMFIPDPGKIFIYRDFSQAEARVVAYLARCNGLIELFEDPTRDIHRENASRMFGVSIDKVTYEQRYLAKRAVHACNYGMEAARLVEIVNADANITGVRIVYSQAQDIIEAYFLLYPEINNHFWREVEQRLKRTLTLDTPFGRKRTFFGRWEDKLLREAYSYIPQSTVGDLCCKALVSCYHNIEVKHPEWGAQLLLSVHDSLLMQCDEAHVEQVATAMRDAMDIEMEINGYKFKIPTDCRVGHNWRDKQKDGSNPNGLTELK